MKSVSNIIKIKDIFSNIDGITMAMDSRFKEIIFDIASELSIDTSASIPYKKYAKHFPWNRTVELEDRLQWLDNVALKESTNSREISLLEFWAIFYDFFYLKKASEYHRYYFNVFENQTICIYVGSDERWHAFLMSDSDLLKNPKYFGPLSIYIYLSEA